MADAWDKILGEAVVNTVMKIPVPKKARNFLTG
jgi:hypothetical protein